eukprot:TRINITY_DN27951_c0_g1_i1.p1 TRINITY_DN27951_c0_g1~~TRINITY_DN27951_c0_g1_i1.p1  ORF type:complete len:289 (+),score=59.15 TRINITY_DN27951_c0_g1_i1:81-947(+)
MMAKALLETFLRSEGYERQSVRLFRTLAAVDRRASTHKEPRTGWAALACFLLCDRQYKEAGTELHTETSGHEYSNPEAMVWSALADIAHATTHTGNTEEDTQAALSAAVQELHEAFKLDQSLDSAAEALAVLDPEAAPEISWRWAERSPSNPNAAAAAMCLEGVSMPEAGFRWLKADPVAVEALESLAKYYELSEDGGGEQMLEAGMSLIEAGAELATVRELGWQTLCKPLTVLQGPLGSWGALRIRWWTHLGIQRLGCPDLPVSVGRSTLSALLVAALHQLIQQSCS